MRNFSFIFSIISLSTVTSAMANWQYPNRYSRDVWSGDDGSRFVLSVRGGAAYGRANIENKIGGLTTQYVMNQDTGEIVTRAWQEAADPTGNYLDAGYGRLGDLPAANKYSEFAFVAGFSAGFTMPYVPQWRIEFGYDHISETDYNQNPLFEGVLPLSSGYVVEAQSGSVQSTLAADIYGVMAFYDFFDGIQKPIGEFIPYVGVGAGYAESKTVMQLTDSYGDLSDVYELQSYGEVDTAGVIQFNKSESETSNLVPMIAGGVSYGLNERMFLDAGLRLMYVPKVKWQLSNTTTDRRRDWFNADKMIYANAMLGLRIEF